MMFPSLGGKCFRGFSLPFLWLTGSGDDRITYAADLGNCEVFHYDVLFMVEAVACIFLIALVTSAVMAFIFCCLDPLFEKDVYVDVKEIKLDLFKDIRKELFHEQDIEEIPSEEEVVEVTLEPTDINAPGDEKRGDSSTKIAVEKDLDFTKEQESLQLIQSFLKTTEETTFFTSTPNVFRRRQFPVINSRGCEKISAKYHKDEADPQELSGRYSLSSSSDSESSEFVDSFVNKTLTNAPKEYSDGESICSGETSSESTRPKYSGFISTPRKDSNDFSASTRNAEDNTNASGDNGSNFSKDEKDTNNLLISQKNEESCCIC